MSASTVRTYPVLIAGGSGTRLWPVSRALFPKQLVSFFGQETLIQNTIKRILPTFESDTIRVVCGVEHSAGIVRDMEAVGIPAEGRIIGEPCGRNTAPAILLAVLNILKHEEDAVIFIFPADHLVEDVDIFREKIKAAAGLALQGLIVTFGITPTYPETGYGYIEASDTKIRQGLRIKRFVEKPDLKTARRYLKAGNFFWNSGMFAFKGSVICEEFKKFYPDIFKQVQEIVSGKKELSAENYGRVKDISIDYAIMEHTAKAAVLPSDFGWSDIGSWKSLYDFMPKDGEENVIASGDVILQNTKKCFLMGMDRLIAVNHLENIVVVETPDAVFVSDMENSRDVKSIVRDLKEKDRKEYLVHATVYEPWGCYTVIESSSQLTVTRLTLNKNARLPAQLRSDASTQWIVINGSAAVDQDQKSIVLSEGQTVTIPKNTPCELKNTGESELHLIEIEKYP
jgi:mannose-1-phosphate guanylyltransferase/mannose-6-phosphate isomerase